MNIKNIVLLAAQNILTAIPFIIVCAWTGSFVSALFEFIVLCVSLIITCLQIFSFKYKKYMHRTAVFKAVAVSCLLVVAGIARAIADTKESPSALIGIVVTELVIALIICFSSVYEQKLIGHPTEEIKENEEIK
jgi:hypothetical protein